MSRATDDWLADFARLTDVEWRKSAEAERGIFIAEGARVIRRALQLGYRPRCVLTQPKWSAQFTEFANLDIRVVADAELADIAGFQVHRGALAAFERPPAKGLADVIADNRRLLFVEDVLDHENIGGIFRNAAGLGVEGVLLTTGCADPLYRRSVKVSMAATLAVPYAIVADSQQCMAQLVAQGFGTFALTPSGEVPLGQQSVTERWALLVGTEGAGLSPQLLRAADVRLSIPMSGGTDSLNVATAAAVAMWEFARH